MNTLTTVDGAALIAQARVAMDESRFEEAIGMAQQALDQAADEATLGLDDTERERIEASVAVVNAVYGEPQRIAALAADLAPHRSHPSAGMGNRPAAPGQARAGAGTRPPRERRSLGWT